MAHARSLMSLERAAKRGGRVFRNSRVNYLAGELSLEDAWLIAQHIEVSDADLDDRWLPAERFEDLLQSLPPKPRPTLSASSKMNGWNGARSAPSAFRSFVASCS